MTVEWPMLLLYDEANQSDFVAAFDERCALEDHELTEVTWVSGSKPEDDTWWNLETKTDHVNILTHFDAKLLIVVYCGLV